MPVRPALFVGVALLALPCGFLLHDRAGPVGISTVVAVWSVIAMTAGWSVRARLLHRVAIVAGSLSLVITAYVVLTEATIYTFGINLGPVELIALYVLLAATARWVVPLRVSVMTGTVVWVACTVWILRLTQYWPPAEPEVGPWPLSSLSDLFTQLSHFAGSAFFPTLAVVAGAVPRYLAYRRRELIAAARREQRLELAQDLHDYVAHDLTGIVAQAQAAQFARAEDPDHLRGALERIEQVGLAALETMDGFVHVLHDQDAAPRSMGQIADIPALVARFRAERGPGTPVRVDVDDGVQTRASREVQATAYRIVVEGLTNVRRHAGPDSPVTVSVGDAPDGNLSVVVLSEVDTAPRSLDGRLRARGGTGLTALHERVSAVGGHLDAGRDDSGRWRLDARLPAAHQGGAR